MSGLETLPPDQRAVLQLILVQGRGYADLAGLLKIDVHAVRDRALAGIEALAAGDGEPPAPEQRERIADYLLGQQDDAERIVTLAQLGESPAASRWAHALHARIAPLASGPLPEVPAPASANGVASHAAPAVPSAAAPAPATPVPAAPNVSDPPAAAPAADAPATATSASAPEGASATPPTPRAPSRLGGAILIGAVAVLVAVLLIVLLSGGDDHKATPHAATPAATSTAATQPRTSTTATQPAASLVGQANLAATPAGGKAIGLGLVQRSGRTLALAIEAQRLPANGSQDVYGVWLQGSPGAKFLGFVPQRVPANGTVTVSAKLPGNVRSYSTVLIAHEPASGVPTQPGQAVLSGALKFR